MKKVLAILICKILYRIGKLVGKGSSLPGKYALKIDSKILLKIQLPEYVLAVTGSCGKTSTVEMIATALEEQGYNVGWNKEGSNQIEGVTTMLLRNCSLTGKVKKDIIVLETDERYARHSFKYFKPTHFMITNLYRDQLTRNGNPNWTYKAISQAIYPEMKLILNADDPLVSKFSTMGNNVTWFGISQTEDCEKECSSVYDDGSFCPICGARMTYNYRHYSHIGDYACSSCDYKRHIPNYSGALTSNSIIINDSYEVKTNFDSAYNYYNLLSAFTACSEMGADKPKLAMSLSKFVAKSGRVVTFKIGTKDGVLLTSKHENSISYNQSINYIRKQMQDVTVAVIVDAISRKYFTGETSWLWDIDFEKLNCEHVKHIILCGKYAYDLANRFRYTDIDQAKIKVVPDLDNMINEMSSTSEEKIFAVTCFSDKNKLLSRVN